MRLISSFAKISHHQVISCHLYSVIYSYCSQCILVKCTCHHLFRYGRGKSDKRTQKSHINIRPIFLQKTKTTTIQRLLLEYWSDKHCSFVCIICIFVHNGIPCTLQKRQTSTIILCFGNNGNMVKVNYTEFRHTRCVQSPS